MIEELSLLLPRRLWRLNSEFWFPRITPLCAIKAFYFRAQRESCLLIQSRRLLLSLMAELWPLIPGPLSYLMVGAAMKPLHLHWATSVLQLGCHASAARSAQRRGVHSGASSAESSQGAVSTTKTCVMLMVKPKLYFRIRIILLPFIKKKRRVRKSCGCFV